MLEFDGMQHFKYTPIFQNDIETFYEQQQIDIIKTTSAIIEGYHMITIDYMQIHNIPFHMEQAFLLKQKLYLSTPILYSYLYQNDIS